MFGLAALTVAFVGLSELLGGGLDRPPPWASWLRIVLGTALIVVGVWRWLTRHRSAHAPAWLQAISSITPARAGGAGALLAVINPKVLFICLASGLTIGTAGLGVGGAWAALVVFVLVAASSVAVPVLGYAAAGERLDEPLARLKDWLERHNAALVAVILVVIGLLCCTREFTDWHKSGCTVRRRRRSNNAAPGHRRKVPAPKRNCRAVTARAIAHSQFCSVGRRWILHPLFRQALVSCGV